MKLEEATIKTLDEAIETIKANMPTNGYQMLRESLDMAIEALEIQKPRKPKARKHAFGAHTYHCPCCEGYIGSSVTIVPGYCEWCGQAIDTENLEGMEDARD